MKLPERKIEGVLYALAYSKESLAKELGSKYSSTTLYEDRESAESDAYYADDMHVFEIKVTIE